MRWTKPATWLAIASALLVSWLVWLDRGRTSPGPVSAAHAQEPALSSDGCEQCHGDDAQDMPAACGACHAAITDQIVQKRGLHGTMQGDAAHCGRCHSEHHGSAFALVGALSFAQAGVPDVTRYDHAHVDFTLAGRHAELACKACHPHAEVEVLKKGEQRFLGLAQRCESCHEDVHHGQLPDCAACHGEEHPFAEVAQFVHTSSFPLEGSHAGPQCVACHAKDSPHAIEAEHITPGALAVSTAAARTCQDCHASPHSAPFLSAAALAQHVDPAASCAACHPTAHVSFVDERVALTAAQHAASGFALDTPHDHLACNACHAAGTRADDAVEKATFASYARAHPGRKAGDCAACHGDPHGGQFASGVFAGAACATCHAAAHFLPAAFDIEQHVRTSFALTGSHQAVGCADCHRETRTLQVKGKPMSSRVFHGTPSDCRACHADAHAGAFDRVGLPTAIDGRLDCARCHTTESFAVTEAQFDHTRWTAFVLDGAHARAECSVCHAPSAVPDANGRTFGRVRDHFRGDPTRCVTCHADAHRGAFDGQALPTEIDGRRDCARCHASETFATAAQDFDHARWTGFALEGAHARASCEVCHRSSAEADASGRRFGRCAVTSIKASGSCTSCHVDAHAGAFDRGRPAAEIDGRSGCLRCHTQDSFREVRPGSFDHARSTGFALAGAHVDLDCAACHDPVTSSDGRTQRLARARGTQCADCHVDPHAAQFAQNGRTDCARCHANGPDFRTLVFDHQRDTRFALDATHAKVACGACHVQTPLPDGSKVVRYKPLGTACSDCHDPRGAKLR